MATIETNITGKGSKQKGINKKNTRVDLTPMVDLGFLLITFFVFTTQLSQPTVMNLNMPNDTVEPGDEICASCVLTLFLQADNTIQYYEGMPESHTALKQTSFAANGIRNIILEKKWEIKNRPGQKAELVLIIKPSDESTFQNFVDIVDEVAINNVKHYYLDEVNAADKMFLAKK